MANGQEFMNTMMPLKFLGAIKRPYHPANQSLCMVNRPRHPALSRPHYSEKPSRHDDQHASFRFTSMTIQNQHYPTGRDSDLRQAIPILKELNEAASQTNNHQHWLCFAKSHEAKFRDRNCIAGTNRTVVSHNLSAPSNQSG